MTAPSASRALPRGTCTVGFCADDRTLSMTSSIAQKLGAQTGDRAYLADVPAALRRTLAGHLTPAKQLRGHFDYLHAFVTRQRKLEMALRRLRPHLAPRGRLWISWPKTRQLDTDLTLPLIIRIGYGHGLVESKTLSVDATWSAIKFTHPRPGKRYRNSYGKLTVPRRGGRAAKVRKAATRKRNASRGAKPS